MIVDMSRLLSVSSGEWNWERERNDNCIKLQMVLCDDCVDRSLFPTDHIASKRKRMHKAVSDFAQKRYSASSSPGGTLQAAVAL
mmetsp:Transcript_1583/g.3382  ORF Transcript_1583/g.3382 Transcript_1583/m.3382 type:complete len:84 (-) Transcript_1583:187-438(-)